MYADHSTTRELTYRMPQFGANSLEYPRKNHAITMHTNEDFLSYSLDILRMKGQLANVNDGVTGFFQEGKNTKQTRCHGNPNGSRKRRVYYGAGGAAGRRIRDCELVGTCYDIDRVADNRLLTKNVTIVTITTSKLTLLN